MVAYAHLLLTSAGPKLDLDPSKEQIGLVGDGVGRMRSQAVELVA